MSSGLGVDLLLEHRLQDGIAHFLKGSRVGGFAVKNLDDVEAILRFHEIGNLALRQAEGGLLKFRDGLAFDDPAQVAAFGLGGVVFGIFLGEILEIGAVLGLLQDVLGLLADFGGFGVGLADGLEENVLDVSAVFDFVFVDVLVVVGAQAYRR